MSDATQENAAANPAPSAEELAAAAKAKAAADAKADGLHTEIAAISTEIDRLKTRLAEAADKVATDPSFHGYASAFVADVRHKVAEIHAWMGRHLA